MRCLFLSSLDVAGEKSDGEKTVEAAWAWSPCPPLMAMLIFLGLLGENMPGEKHKSCDAATLLWCPGLVRLRLLCSSPAPPGDKPVSHSPSATEDAPTMRRDGDSVIELMADSRPVLITAVISRGPCELGPRRNQKAS